MGSSIFNPVVCVRYYIGCVDGSDALGSESGTTASVTHEVPKGAHSLIVHIHVKYCFDYVDDEIILPT